jgi:hypothetical protein
VSAFRSHRVSSAGNTRTILLLFAAALVVRLLWAWYGLAVIGDAFNVPGQGAELGDAKDYITVARNLVQHQAFSLALSEPYAPTAVRPPLYSFLIAALWWGDNPPIRTLLLLQAFLGALTVLLTYLLARQVFGQRVAILTGSLMILAPMSGYYTGRAMTEVPYTFLIVLGAYIWIAGRPISSGVVFGLSTLMRPNTLMFLVLVALAAVAFKFFYRLTVRRYLVMAAVGLLIAGVWIFRNYLALGRFVPIVSTGGEMLYFGTVDIPYGSGNTFGVLFSDPVAQSPPPLDTAERDRYFYTHALQRFLDDPARWFIDRLRLYPRMYLDSGEYLYSFAPHFATLIKPLFIAKTSVLIIALIGLYAERTALLKLGPIMLLPLVVAASQFPLWVESRYSLPLMPFIAMLAAAGVLWFRDWLRIRLGQLHPTSFEPPRPLRQQAGR